MTTCIAHPVDMINHKMTRRNHPVRHVLLLLLLLLLLGEVVIVMASMMVKPSPGAEDARDTLEAQLDTPEATCGEGGCITRQREGW